MSVMTDAACRPGAATKARGIGLPSAAASGATRSRWSAPSCAADLPVRVVRAVARPGHPYQGSMIRSFRPYRARRTTRSAPMSSAATCWRGWSMAEPVVADHGFCLSSCLHDRHIPWAGRRLCRRQLNTAIIGAPSTCLCVSLVLLAIAISGALGPARSPPSCR